MTAPVVQKPNKLGRFVRVTKGAVLCIGTIEITVVSGDGLVAVRADGHPIEVRRRARSRRDTKPAIDGE